MRPSASLGDSVNIFTGALPGYGKYIYIYQGEAGEVIKRESEGKK